MNSSLKATLEKTADLGNGSQVTALSTAATFTNGSGADKVNMTWSDERSINASSSDDLDLYGVLTDIFGDTINAAVVRGFTISNLNTNNTLSVGAAASNPWVAPFGGATHTVTVRQATANNAASIQFIAPDATGYAVANGSSDTLRVTNNSEVAEAAIYQIGLLIEV
jgi:hypothetical protein